MYRQMKHEMNSLFDLNIKQPNLLNNFSDWIPEDTTLLTPLHASD